MEILFESNTEEEEKFNYDGEVIINKGFVQIIKGDPFNLGMKTDETNPI